MIYIIEIPHRRPVSAWSRATEKEVIEVIEESSCKSGDIIYEQSTALEILDIYGAEYTEDLKETDLDLYELLSENALSRVYYKTFEDDEYSVEKPNKFEAYLSYNAHDLHAQRVFMSRNEAVEALNNADYWRRMHQGIEARIALENILEVNNK